jgi:alginate O-acetyltransferase complex protein AlgI
MLFSSLIFIFAFLPIVLLLYYLCPRKGKNGILLIASLFFYAWGGISLSTVLLFSFLANYLFGIWIENASKSKTFKLPITLGVIFNVLLLGVAKYANFAVENINNILISNEISPIKNPNIVLPLGISFFTFHAMSYLIDVYRKVTPAQHNILKLALYISFFPQLIAGPIVRYHDIAPQLSNRKETISAFSKGIERFVLGLVKKVIVANQFAIVANEAFHLNPEILPQQLAWAGVICFSFQIYFDFAGYSDMAVGMGLMFGFKLPENFNYPYISRSIREFWKRWHMTLGQWLRDYLYIPLGGNRVGTFLTYLNLIIVFTLCGFWHGANWNFIIWGLAHGLFMVIERLWLEKHVLMKLGKVIPAIYTFSIASLLWVLFQTEDFTQSVKIYKILFFGNPEFTGSNYISNFFSLEFMVIAIPAILGTFGFFPWIKEKVIQFAPKLQTPKLTVLLKSVGIIVAMIVVTILLISDTFNPFIYFRF